VYRVRLEIGSRHWEQPLTVMPDPRVSVSQQDYAAQFALAKDLAAALDASSAKAQEVKALRAQLKKLGTAQGAAIAAQAKELDEHFDALMDQGPNAQPGGAHRGLEHVNGDILSLYTLVREADAAPTQAQRAAADSLSKEWQSLAAAAAKISQDHLAPFNQALTRAKLPALRSDAAAPDEGESTDEE
jgi:cell division protein FtsB